MGAELGGQLEVGGGQAYGGNEEGSGAQAKGPLNVLNAHPSGYTAAAAAAGAVWLLVGVAYTCTSSVCAQASRVDSRHQ